MLVASLATYAFSLLSSWMNGDEQTLFLLHRMVYLLFWIIGVTMIGTSRLVYMMIVTKDHFLFHMCSKQNAKRTMVIGASFTGANVVREMQRGHYGHAIPIVVVEDNCSRIGASLSGVPVVSGTENIAKLVKQYAIDDIVVAISSHKSDLSPLFEQCLSTGCKVRRVVPLKDISQENTHSVALQDIDINDLLGRPEEHLDMSEVATFVKGKTVLITGGGGSIGSELCRVLLSFEPEKIVLYDINENHMYDLYAQMRLRYSDTIAQKLLLRVGSVRDEERLAQVFETFQPHIVLHAAAHKHVPLMEDSPTEAIKNNVFGTYLTAKTANQFHVERFVFISTDKAVNPTNVMGATKRMAEMIIEAFNGQSQTEYIAVRFGNMLGSHGSVIPLFAQQIQAGGPVTLTHPDIIRYFMTIPEAASLVLQAATMAKGGELFVLDMGKPVKNENLAKRMIQLYSDKSSTPIKIVYTGLRPREKLYEELLLASEGIAKTSNKKIFIARPEKTSMQYLNEMPQKLKDNLSNKTQLVAVMRDFVSTFKDPEVVNQAVVSRNQSA